MASQNNKMAHYEMDDLDRRILMKLQQDGRIRNNDLADHVGLSPAPCLRRVKALEEAGIISGYVAVLDAERVGQSLQAFVEVKLDRQSKRAIQEFEKAIQNIPNVLECTLIAGEWDYLMRVIASDIQGYRSFLVDRLTSLPGVASVKSSFAMQRVKCATALPLG
jgi:Lrp/AsnC family transcriptional regulator, leucine-responsive regulatory protein